MTSGKGLVERAYELAATGDYRTVSELRGRLRGEGFGMVDCTQHLGGRGIRDQLRAVITTARG